MGCFLRRLCFAGLLCCAVPAAGQRVQFPATMPASAQIGGGIDASGTQPPGVMPGVLSPPPGSLPQMQAPQIPQAAPQTPGMVPATPGAASPPLVPYPQGSTILSAPGVGSPGPGAYPPPVRPQVPPGQVYAAPGTAFGVTPGASAPAPYSVYPGSTAPTFAPPGAGLSQTPPPSWDPAAPYGGQPCPLLPQDPYVTAPVFTPGLSMTTMYRFLQDVRVDYTWMAGNAFSDWGFNQVDLSATFTIPLLRGQMHPFLITPGFTVYSLNNPGTFSHELDGPAPGAPLGIVPPHQLYDAYLDVGWNPRFTPWFGAELGVRVGVYSDFNHVTEKSIRVTGRGLAVFMLSPSLQAKAGLLYLARNRVGVLPAGGLVWTPNSDVRFDILFPNPRFATRLTTYGTTDWWLYLRGEYGGDSWTISGFWTDRITAATPVPGFYPTAPAQMDYNDIRVALGLEFLRPAGLTGLFEVGCAFDRELRLATGPVFYPTTTAFLRASLAY